MLVEEKSRAAAASRGAVRPAFRLDDGATIFVPEAIQSNVIRSVNPQHARYVFFQIVDGDAFRRFVGNLLNPAEQSGDADAGFSNQPADVRTLGSEASAHTYDPSGKRTVKALTWNLAFTWTGLQALGIDANTLASFPEDFRDGMAARATRLGDVGDSAPEHWEGWLGSRDVHGILMVASCPRPGTWPSPGPA